MGGGNHGLDSSPKHFFKKLGVDDCVLTLNQILHKATERALISKHSLGIRGTNLIDNILKIITKLLAGFLESRHMDLIQKYSILIIGYIGFEKII